MQTISLRKFGNVLVSRPAGLESFNAIRPTLNAEDPIQIAFTEIVSGRSPEKRGNGLKVVRRIVETHPIGLLFRSGLAVAQCPRQGGSIKIRMEAENIRGTYTVLTF